METNQLVYFSNKKTLVSFILSLFVFFIHFSVFSAFSAAGSTMKNVLDFFYAFTYVAVPLYFVISGVLFYRDYTPRKTLYKWKKRFFSLCIPYLFWNTFWLVLALLGNYTPLGAFTGGCRTELTLQAVLRGVFLHEFFTPFWFIQYLIVFTLFCPVIWFLVAHKVIGMTVIILYFIANIGVDCLGISTLWINTSLFYYLIGAWIGIHGFDEFTSKKSGKLSRLLVLLFILCCVFFFYTVRFPAPFLTKLQPIVKIVACYSFWGGCDAFSIQNCPQFMKDSFLIYALHSFVGASISKILVMLFPSGQMFLGICAVLSFVGTIAVILILGGLLERYAPGIKRLVTGRESRKGRISSTKRKELVSR